MPPHLFYSSVLQTGILSNTVSCVYPTVFEHSLLSKQTDIGKVWVYRTSHRYFHRQKAVNNFLIFWSGPRITVFSWQNIISLLTSVTDLHRNVSMIFIISIKHCKQRKKDISIKWWCARKNVFFPPALSHFKKHGVDALGGFISTATTALALMIAN